MSTYEKGSCEICGVATTIESGCAPICGSSLCESEWDIRQAEIESGEEPLDPPEKKFLTQDELLAKLPKE